MLTILKEIMEDEAAGDPMSSLKWTHKSLRKLKATLFSKGLNISAPTISRLLKEEDYSLKANRKRLSGKQNPERDQQF